jgi:hypothetical protein
MWLDCVIRTRHQKKGRKGKIPVEEPRARVVGAEADRDVVAGRADSNDVAAGRVVVVVGRAAGAADNIEGVAVQLMPTG